MDDFTRKFDAAQDKDEQIHFILTSVKIFAVGRTHCTIR